jgi:colicin import membrane protein
VAARWRTRAGAQGWKTHAPVAIAVAAPAAPAAAGAPAAGAAPAGQPEGKLTPAGAAAPIKSEKLGTAPPSTDVKAGPTKAEPRGTPPTVQKGTPKVDNR